MRYENHQPKEGINVSDEHPLKEFAQLVVGITIAVLIVVSLLTYFAGALVRYIPFSYEQQMVSGIDYFQPQVTLEQERLQTLANKLSQHMGLPEGMTITLHIDQDDTVNAFATLGGHVVFFQGLLDQVESEQELAAVMAHEIAHIKLRHPIVATGKGLTLATVASVFSGFSASSAGDWLIGNSINLSLMRFSRAQELEADAIAACALQQEYGTIFGAKSLFERFAKLENDSLASAVTTEAFRSHPYSQDRWQVLVALASREGWSTQATKTPSR